MSASVPRVNHFAVAGAGVAIVAGAFVAVVGSLLVGGGIAALGLLVVAIHWPRPQWPTMHSAAAPGAPVTVTVARHRPPAPASTAAPVILTGTGKFALPAVGESHYQDALEEICGGRSKGGRRFSCSAILTCEDENPHDHRAVRVDINGRTVGYLSRDRAPRYRAALKKAGHARAMAQCGARIVGGWDRGGDDRGHFGVKLDVPVDW